MKKHAVIDVEEEAVRRFFRWYFRYKAGDSRALKGSVVAAFVIDGGLREVQVQPFRGPGLRIRSLDTFFPPPHLRKHGRRPPPPPPREKITHCGLRDSAAWIRRFLRQP